MLFTTKMILSNVESILLKVMSDPFYMTYCRKSLLIPKRAFSLIMTLLIKQTAFGKRVSHGLQSRRLTNGLHVVCITEAS